MEEIKVPHHNLRYARLEDIKSNYQNYYHIIYHNNDNNRIS
jgi:hypothetical protein